MLIVSVVLVLLLTIYSYGRIGFARTFRVAPFSILVTVVFVALWIAAILFLTQGQGWARFLVSGLLLWGIVTLILGFSRVHWHGMFQGTMLLTWLIALVRIIAITLLFTPESEAWFRSSYGATVKGSPSST